MMEPTTACFGLCLLVWMLRLTECKVADFGGWSNSLESQYHIQTDEGEERYFKYQTKSGQYRKEKRLQDGTVVGTYGWVDPAGYLRLQDYIADNQGFRILKTKLIYVGGNALEEQSSTTKSDLVEKKLPPSYKYRQPLYANLRRPTFEPQFLGTPPLDLIPPNTEHRFLRPGDSDRIHSGTSFYYVHDRPSEPLHFDKPFLEYPREYDGVSTVQNGFRYYLPRHYHEELSSPNGRDRTGSYGYIDPFGIRRVIYYNASPDRGFVHRKNNRYVGFYAAPYDPRPEY